MSRALAAVQALPADVVVLYVSVLRDGAGVPHVSRDVLRQIAAVSPVPVFGLFETYLGHGIATGSIATYGALMLHRRRLRRAQATSEDEHARRTRGEALAAQLRGRLARFSKDRSLGTMATTIAHEINQPLVAIQNYAQASSTRRPRHNQGSATPLAIS